MTLGTGLNEHLDRHHLPEGFVRVERSWEAREAPGAAAPLCALAKCRIVAAYMCTARSRTTGRLESILALECAPAEAT